MKTILFLQDEAAPPTQLLQDAVQTKVPFRDTEAVAGCNCDRWGHPCPRCVKRVVEATEELLICTEQETK